MIAAFITDTHLCKQTVEINQSIFTQLKEYVVKNNIKHIIHGGDIFNSRKAQEEVVLNCFHAILYDLSKIAHIHIVPGNHDKTNYSSTQSFLDVYKSNNKKIHIYSNPQSFEIDEENNFIFLPFFDVKLTYHHYLKIATKLIKDNKYNWLFTHIDVEGYHPPHIEKYINTIGVDYFNAFDKVMIGHYHDAKVINNIVYTGSAYQANFGENTEKGLCILKNKGVIKHHPLLFPVFTTLDARKSNSDTSTLQHAQTLLKTGCKVRCFVDNKINKTLKEELRNIGCKIENKSIIDNNILSNISYNFSLYEQLKDWSHQHVKKDDKILQRALKLIK